MVINNEFSSLLTYL